MEQRVNKNAVIKIFLFLLALLLAYFIFNRFDASGPPGVFTHKDLVPASFEKSNGFYFVVALGEPPGKEILSDEITTKYRRLFDPTFDNDRWLQEWDSRAYINRTFPYKRIIRCVNQYRKDWFPHVSANSDKIKKISGQVSFLLDRYQQLVNSDMIRDFTSVRFRVDSETLLMMSRLYTALRIIDFLTGDPGEITGILAQIHMCKKLIRSSRSLSLTFTIKKILQESLMALTGAMNQRECTREIVSRVFNRLTPLTYDQFGSRNAFIGHYLAIEDWMDSLEGQVERGETIWGRELGHAARAFFQEQRTRNYYFLFISTCIEYEKRPPFRWGSPIPEAGNLQKGPLWWLQNPTGKYLYSELYNPDFKGDILASHYTKAVYDMSRICAELHLNYTGKKPVNEVLNQLSSFQTLDPFSGNSYIWNESKQVLYGVGLDRSDNGGVYIRRQVKGSDIVIPCLVKKIREEDKK